VTLEKIQGFVYAKTPVEENMKTGQKDADDESPTSDESRWQVRLDPGSRPNPTDSHDGAHHQSEPEQDLPYERD